MEQRDRKEGTGEKGYLEKNKNKEKKELEWGRGLNLRRVGKVGKLIWETGNRISREGDNTC